MNRIRRIILFFSIVFLSTFFLSQQIYAACGGGGAECTNTPCQILTPIESCTTPDIYGNQTCTTTGTYWTPGLCCTYYQSGGGSCSCCVGGDDTCYLNCGNPPSNPTDPEPTVVPGNTPTPVPPPVILTPTPTILPGTVRARAVQVPNGTATCNAVQTSTSYIPVGITLYGEGVTKTTAVDGSYVTWANALAGTKSFVDAPPADYVLVLACWDTNSPAAQGSGYSTTLSSGDTLTWQLGYTAGAGWYQSQGGDVFARTSLRSYVPSGAVGGRYFSTNGAGGTPGVVTYGTTYDFDSESTGVGTGPTYVSTTNWLANEVHPVTDYYAIMFHRFGSPTVADSQTTSWIGKPAAAPTNGSAYYINGDLSIDGPITVTNGDSIVVLVSGKLTINNRITITPGSTGFIAFIVNGDITVDSSVGTTSTSSTPVVEGIYITSPAGTFRTSPSTTAAARRFVGKGTFVAGNIALERDLDADTRNTTYAADYFIYNPELLIRMPEKMKDLPVSWQEVAP